MLRTAFFTNTLKPLWLLIFFGLFVSTGCFHTWVAFHYFPHHGDIWVYFAESVRMKRQLMEHPASFFSIVLPATGEFNMTDASKPVLDIQYQLLQRLNILFDFLSFDNLYVNTLLFNMPVFAGAIALFRFFYIAFNRVLAACSALLLPSILFWTSVVYKDGLFFIGIGCCCYLCIKNNFSSWKKWAAIVGCFLLIGLTRANALICLLPSLLFLYLSKKHWSRYVIVSVVITAGLIATACINMILPGGLLLNIANKQNAFQQLSGGSAIYLPALQPNLQSVINILPVAALNGYLAPLPGSGGKSIYSLFSVELISIWVLWTVALVQSFRNKRGKMPAAEVTCLLLALPALLIIGYMVPFVGTIVRYRAVYLPFILAPALNMLCRYQLPLFVQANKWLSRKLLPGKASIY